MLARTALLAVTGNAVVMAAAGVSAPIGWLLVPAVAGMWSRPRAAALVSGWAGALILVSVAVPIVPGHLGDKHTLATSGVCLVLLPMLSWGRHRVSTCSVPPLLSGPTVESVATGQVGRQVVLATSGLAGELAAAVQPAGRRVWALVGMVMGEVPDPARCARQVQQAWRTETLRPGARLEKLPDVLAAVVRRYAPDGYVCATLVRVSPAGTARVLRCGSPEILAVPAAPGREGAPCVVVDAGPGGSPLGPSVVEPAWSAHKVPDNARIAVVTPGYACAHYDDYIDAVDEALRALSVELAAVRLLLGPSSGAGRVVGPALVLDAVTRAR